MKVDLLPGDRFEIHLSLRTGEQVAVRGLDLVLPRVPLLLVMHRGDEEFPPDCRVLFDRCCSHYLNTDDLKVLSTQLAAYLMKGAGVEADTENLLWMVE